MSKDNKTEKAPETTYWKLNSKEGVFWDPVSRTKILPNVPAEFTGTLTPRIKAGSKHGHITEIDKDEYDRLVKSSEDGDEGATPDFSDKKQFPDKDSLVKYFKDTFENTEEEIKEFEDLKRGEQEKLLAKLESES